MSLGAERCVACRRDSPRVTEQEIAELQTQVTEWELTEPDSVKRLERSFRFPDFVSAQAFAISVGDAAEIEGHHPRITLEWGRVTVEWWTHEIKDLHRNDFIMAAKTQDLYGDATVQRLPPMGSTLVERSSSFTTDTTPGYT